MKKTTFMIMLLVTLLVTSSAVAADIILLPGLGQKEEQIAVLGRRIGGEVVMIENKLPLWTAVKELEKELEKRGKTGKVVIVGFSWGGLIARKFAENHPERVAAVVVIGSPNGGYWFAPAAPFRVLVERSVHVPLFVVAGEKSEKKWWLADVNDGVVDVDSVFDVPFLKRGIILNLAHNELWASRVVASVVSSWIEEFGGGRHAAK